MIRRRVVRVPASSANLGPGFDCFAAALGLHLELEVTRDGPASPSRPTWTCRADRENLCVRAFESLHPADDFTFRIGSDIPLTGGLGSSASAIVAGLLAADHLFELDIDLLAVRHRDRGPSRQRRRRAPRRLRRLRRRRGRPLRSAHGPGGACGRAPRGGAHQRGSRALPARGADRAGGLQRRPRRPAHLGLGARRLGPGRARPARQPARAAPLSPVPALLRAGSARARARRAWAPPSPAPVPPCSCGASTSRPAPSSRRCAARSRAGRRSCVRHLRPKAHMWESCRAMDDGYFPRGARYCGWSTKRRPSGSCTASARSASARSSRSTTSARANTPATSAHRSGGSPTRAACSRRSSSAPARRPTACLASSTACTSASSGRCPRMPAPTIPRARPTRRSTPTLMLWTVAVIADSAEWFYDRLVRRLTDRGARSAVAGLPALRRALQDAPLGGPAHLSRVSRLV